MNEQHFVGLWVFLWTMGIEWKFYLLWPVILFLSLTPKRKVSPRSRPICSIQALAILDRTAVSLCRVIAGRHSGDPVASSQNLQYLRFLMNPVASVLLFACVAVMQVYRIHVRRIAGPFGGPTGILIYGILVAFFSSHTPGEEPRQPRTEEPTVRIRWQSVLFTVFVSLPGCPGGPGHGSALNRLVIGRSCDSGWTGFCRLSISVGRDADDLDRQTA